MTHPDSPSTIDSPWLTAAEPVDESVTMPQSLAGVFDEAFDLYKRHFGLLAMIVAVGLIPVEILRNMVIALWLHPLDAHLSGVANANPDSMVLLRIGQFIFGEPRSGFAGVLAFLMLILLSAPISVAVSDLYFGRAATVRDCYRRSRPYLLNMIWGYCQVLLMAIGVGFLGTILVSFLAFLVGLVITMAGAPEVAIVIVFAFLSIPYGVYFGIIAKGFVFMTPLTVLEGLPVSYVYNRNNQLVGKKRFWRTWAAVSALPILWIGFQAILYNSLLSALHVLHLPAVLDFVAASAVGSAVHFFLAPYWTIFVTLLYYDYRVRREGFDVRILTLSQPEPTSDTGGAS
jgi:hypothetical protein